MRSCISNSSICARITAISARNALRQDSLSANVRGDKGGKLRDILLALCNLFVVIGAHRLHHLDLELHDAFSRSLKGCVVGLELVVFFLKIIILVNNRIDVTAQADHLAIPLLSLLLRGLELVLEEGVLGGEIDPRHGERGVFEDKRLVLGLEFYVLDTECDDCRTTSLKELRAYTCHVVVVASAFTPSTWRSVFGNCGLTLTV